MVKCEICKKYFKNYTCLGVHISRTHKIKTEIYYDRYFRNYSNNEGFCLICGKNTKFINLNKGYLNHCSVNCRSKNINIKNKNLLSIKNTWKTNKEYILNKRKNTCKMRYGNEIVQRTLKYKNKHHNARLNKNNIGYKNNLPLFKFYDSKINWCEETRDTKEGYLEVRCKKCNKWFIPDLISLQNRLQALNGNRGFAQQNLYCSEECKNICTIYNKQLYQQGQNKNIERPYQAEWSKQVIKNSGYTCEICGSKNNLQAHHEIPVKINPLLQADIDNGICLCRECHSIYGHRGKCNTGNLSKLIC